MNNTKDFDFGAMRSFSTKNSKREWHAMFCSVWDAEGPNAAQAFLRSVPKVFTHLKTLAKNYREGKPGHPFTRHELYALRAPHVPNECLVCGKLVGYSSTDKTWFKTCSKKCASLECVGRREQTCMVRYGEKNPSQVDAIKDKREKTMQERFGVTNAFQSDTIKRRIKKSLVKKYGVDNVSKLDYMTERKAATMLKNFGAEHWTQAGSMRHKIRGFDKESLEKAKATMLKRYGVENPFCLKDVQDQIKLTNKDRYGVSNPGLLFGGFKRKKYVDRFGKKHMVQGYEPRVLEILDSMKSVSSITTKVRAVPTINYKLDGKRRKYYPDIFVKSQTGEHLIEVKSEYTLNLNIEQNVAKFLSASRHCKVRGRTFWLYCFVGKQLIRVKNPKSLRDLRRAGLPV